MQVRLVALVPVLGLLLSGCSGSGDDPEPLPVPTAVPTVSPSPTSAVPAEATGETPQAAAAFARYWYEQLGQAFVTLDSSRIRPLYASSCSKCQNFAESIDTEKATGNRYSGGGLVVRVAEAQQIDSTRTVVQVVYDSNDLLRESGPGAPSPLPARDGIAVQLELIRSSSAWLVGEIREP